MEKQEKPCCPDIGEGKKCDYLDLVYRLNHLAIVHRQRIMVETAIHIRIERCTGPLELGNLVYSTTLLPGERVRLFTQDRSSRFSYDNESQISYRHEQSAAEQSYLSVMERLMSDLQSSSSSHYESSSSGSASSEVDASIWDASVEVSGKYNAKMSKDFLKELRIHTESSHNKSIQAVRKAHSVQIGEVQTRKHAEGESETHLESSSRAFSNNNHCHAVSYLFYQLNKRQHTKVEIQSITFRVIDPANDTRVKNNPIVVDKKLIAIPEAILATKIKTGSLQQVNPITKARLTSFTKIEGTELPMDDDLHTQAIAQVKGDFEKQGVVNKDGSVSATTKTEINFEYTTTIPTPGIIVKSCLDTCTACDEAREKEIALDIEYKRLQNDLLKRKIELLDKSQEYRCCGNNDEEDSSEAE